MGFTNLHLIFHLKLHILNVMHSGFPPNIFFLGGGGILCPKTMESSKNKHNILFICFTILALGSISLDYWNTNQIRVTYQTAYQKNMECRISTNKYGPSSLDKCGKIPVFEDYQK